MNATVVIHGFNGTCYSKLYFRVHIALVHILTVGDWFIWFIVINDREPLIYSRLGVSSHVAIWASSNVPVSAEEGRGYPAGTRARGYCDTGWSC